MPPLLSAEQQPWRAPAPGAILAGLFIGGRDTAAEGIPQAAGTRQAVATTRGGGPRPSAAAAAQLLAEAFEGFARVVGDVEVLGVGKAVEVGPQQHDRLAGDDLNCLVDALRVLGGQRLAEPLERLPLPET